MRLLFKLFMCCSISLFRQRTVAKREERKRGETAEKIREERKEMRREMRKDRKICQKIHM